MKSIIIILFASMIGCAARQTHTAAHTFYDHNENLHFQLNDAIDKQERLDKLDQRMYIKE